MWIVFGGDDTDSVWISAGKMDVDDVLKQKKEALNYTANRPSQGYRGSAIWYLREFPSNWAWNDS